MRNELNLVYYTVRAAWPHLKAYGGGSIINVGSIAALRGWSSCRRTRTAPPRAA